MLAVDVDLRLLDASSSLRHFWRIFVVSSPWNTRMPFVPLFVISRSAVNELEAWKSIHELDRGSIGPRKAMQRQGL